MRRFPALLVITLLSSLLAACGGGSDERVQLTASDNGETVQVSAGEEIQIVLDGNPTTGFSWNALSEPDSAVVAAVDTDFEPSSDAIGSGGTETLTYRAVGNGTTKIDLGYFRPFEPNNVPKKFSVIVAVS